MKRCRILCAAVIGFLVSWSPPSTGARAQCGDFDRAPKLAAGDDIPGRLRTRAAEIWTRVESPFHTLTGHAVPLAITAPEARGSDGASFGPTARICPGVPATVYVAYPMVELALDKEPDRYGPDFLAFVFGHELAHRANDFSESGAETRPFAQRPGKGKRDEALADARAAFLMALAGYHPRVLARAETVDFFLQTEGALPDDLRAARKAELLAALERFDGYETVYRTGVVLALLGLVDTATRLLGWLDDEMAARNEAVPEVPLARALVLLLDAAPEAPWLDRLPVEASHLRCRPVYPGHTALYEEPSAVILRGTGGRSKEEIARLLDDAVAALERARSLGARSFVIESAVACAHVYRGEVRDAAAAQDRAERLRPDDAPAAVVDALAANRALVDFLAFVEVHPTARRDEAEERGAWAEAAGRLTGHPDLAAVLAAPGRGAPGDPAPHHGPAPPQCPPGGGRVQVPAPPGLSGGALGQCPTGWRTELTVPAATVARDSGTTMGVTGCAPEADGGVPGRYVHVRLPETTAPPSRAVDVGVLTATAAGPAAGPLAAWACTCRAIALRGAADLGESFYTVTCPPGTLVGLVVGTDGTVREIHLVTEAW